MNSNVQNCRFCYNVKPRGFIDPVCAPVVCTTNQYISSISSLTNVVNNNTRTTESSLLLAGLQCYNNANQSTFVGSTLQNIYANQSSITNTLQNEIIQLGKDRYTPYQPYIYPIVPSSVTQLLMATANVGVPHTVITCLSGKGSQSVTYLAPGPPASPIILGTTIGNGQLSIRFIIQSITPYNAVASYQYSVNGGTAVSFVPDGNPSTLVVPGLTNGIKYTIVIQTVNSIGVSSATATGIPLS